MSQCTHPDVGRILAAALAPEEFPEERDAVERHLQACGRCKEELEGLLLVDRLVRKHRAELAELLRDCPEPGRIAAYAAGEAVDPEIEEHVETCRTCADEISLLRELHQEAPREEGPPVDFDDRRFVRELVRQEYGPSRAPAESWLGRIAESIRNWLSIPSLAAGAVAATLVLLIALPRGTGELRFIPALSDVSWDVAPPGTKGFPIPTPPVAQKKLALVILTADSNALPPREIDELYRKIEVPHRLAGVYDFLSPAKVKEGLSHPEQIRGAYALAEAFFQKTDASYLITFEVFRSAGGNALKGTIFRRGEGTELASISQTGVKRDRLADRISHIGIELLAEADVP